MVSYNIILFSQNLINQCGHVRNVDNAVAVYIAVADIARIRILA